MSTLMPARQVGEYTGIAFDPAAGITILDPPAPGPGNWMGACDVIRDADSGAYYLYARTRRAADPADPDQRGSRIGIYRSEDGVAFQQIWSEHRSRFDTPSMEKASLSILKDGRHRLYLSYESSGGYWQIDLLEADSFENLDASKRRTILAPSDVGSHQVKDPTAVDYDGAVLLYANYGVSDGGEAAGLAVSEDGDTFQWHGRVLEESAAGCWDCWSSRATGVVRVGASWYMFYDGARARNECFEEQSGVAVGDSPLAFSRLTVEGPLAPGEPRGEVVYNSGRTFASVGGCRYLAPIAAPDGLSFHFYYEWTRPDGSHEVRMSRSAIGLQSVVL